MLTLGFTVRNCASFCALLSLFTYILPWFPKVTMSLMSKGNYFLLCILRKQLDKIWLAQHLFLTMRNQLRIVSGNFCCSRRRIGHPTSYYIYMIHKNSIHLSKFVAYLTINSRFSTIHLAQPFALSVILCCAFHEYSYFFSAMIYL